MYSDCILMSVQQVIKSAQLERSVLILGRASTLYVNLVGFEESFTLEGFGRL